MQFINPRLRERATMYDTQDTSNIYVRWWDYQRNGWSDEVLYKQGSVNVPKQHEYIREEMFGRQTKPPYTAVVQCEHQLVQIEWNPVAFLFPGGGGVNNWYAERTYAKNLLGAFVNYWKPDTPLWLGSGLTQKALDKVVKGDPEGTAIQCLPFLGELRESISMIRNPLSFLKELARRTPNKGTPLMRALRNQGMTATSGGFLEYTYGWKPLIGDLQALSKTFGSFSDDYAEYRRIKEGSQPVRPFRYWAEDTSSETSAGAKPQWYAESRHSFSHHARCLLEGTYNPSKETLSKCGFLANKLGLKPELILPTIWELTTLSFVVDWFIPVGDFLERITATPVDFTVVLSHYDYTLKGSTSVYIGTELPKLPNGNAWPSAGAPLYTMKWDYYAKSASPFFGSEPSWSTNPNVWALLALIQQRLKLPVKRK